MLNDTLKKWLSQQRPTRGLLLPKLHELYQLFIDYEDRESARTCMELIEKLDNMEYVIAFYGHFSAGKSTMINELMGEDLLPSSPIPTSANIVKVKEGEPYALVTFKDGTVQTFPYPYNLEDIQAYCVDGNTVEEVEISHRTGQLPEGVTVFDTPGIDSTDDAHRVSAVSKLHLADVVFYMMDYNHVQSPENFEFNRQLVERGKDNYLIINQIDKHIASELPFDEFAKRIHGALSDHHLTYSGLFFTSLKDAGHPYNQLDELKEQLADRIASRQQQITAHILKESLMLAMNFLKKQQEQSAKRMDRYDELLEYVSSFRQLEEEQTEAAQRKEAVAARQHSFVSMFDQRVAHVFHNAKLMDYYTRLFVREFLESRELSFQVRGLFSRKKTKEEKERRLDQLFQALNENRLTYVDIPLREEIIGLLTEFGVITEERRERIRKCQVVFSPDLLVKLVKSGANLTGDYVLNYAKDVERELQSLYRQAYADIVEPLEEEAMARNKEQIISIQKEQRAIEEKMSAWTEREALKEKERELYERIFDTLAVRGQEKVEKRPFRAFQKSKPSAAKEKPRFISIREAAEQWIGQREPEAFEPIDLEARIQEVKRQASLLAEAGHMEQTIDKLRERIARLEKNEYTIALFGAFSAGKSSFANALLGETVLPVSPNPTTAAINEIRAPDAEHEHGTVMLLFKTEEQFLKDINQALELSGKTASSVEHLAALLKEHDELIAKKQEAKEQDQEEKEEEELFSPLAALPLEQFSFLRAALSGYSYMRTRLGKEERMTVDTYTEFVSVEEKACFVERIQLYYSAPVTEQGMVLVDTPGAGSMNARHTEMAFNYVTSADSVVFVTYYNHAFSRADRAFLMQLGQVKNFKEEDNMFFIVNAADLASSEKDLLSVLQHVEQNLIQCQIHQARIYPVSSHLALLAKKKAHDKMTAEEKKRYGAMLKVNQKEDVPAQQAFDLSGFSLFEERFYPFTKQSLAVSVLRQAEADTKQAVMELKRRIRLAEEDETAKERHRKELNRQLAEALSYIGSRSFKAEREAFEQEIEELLFYARQRLFYRYNDEFKLIFSPAAFDAFDDMFTALHRMTNEVIRFTAEEMAREMRTSAFRLQTFIQKSLDHLVQLLEKETRELLPSVHLKGIEAKGLPEFTFEPGLHAIHAGLFQALFKDYKTSPQFFAEGGNKVIRDEIEKSMMTPVLDYVQEQKERISTALVPVYEELLEKTREAASAQMAEQAAGRLAALSETGGAERYKKLLARLESGIYS
ncbi:dynamin family protein [Bacillus thermotolerans]|uniref:Dynamin N-terminal domain-containing protein n=1 Tax=Bacillus thermotolerans TaxID=1221996 RepID=A0A0F5HUE5_BACTR|nr:dynamin family protein [Bacillus thermotolerans]KKB36873.1 putative protein Bsub YpbR [Bacillus thermotolerans]